MSDKQIDEAVQEYAAGQSLEKIGNRLGFDSTTVPKELRLRGARMRDTHGRERRKSLRAATIVATSRQRSEPPGRRKGKKKAAGFRWKPEPSCFFAIS